MSQELFRREVLEAQRGSWLGSVSLAQPLQVWVLTAAAIALAALVVLYLVLGSYTRRSTVPGQLVPSLGLATVLAPVTGVVSELSAAEGDRVTAGQTLAVITIPRVTPASGDAVVALEQSLQQQQDGLRSAAAARRQLLRTQARGLAAQLAATQRELVQTRAGIATRRQQVEIANQSLLDLRRLREGGYVSLIQVRQQEASVLEQVDAVQSLQREALTAERTIAQLQQALGELSDQRLASEADFQQDRAALSREQIEADARHALALTAPVTGVITTRLVKPGQAVVASQSLFNLVPESGELEAELLVPSRAVGFVEPGDRVLLRYQAFPYQKFGHQLGEVTSVSRSSLEPSVSTPAGRGEPFYRVTVALTRQAVIAYGKAEQLKPGMLLDADILGESRRLIEWIFEPLFALSGRFGNG
jgi:membrane fusion protein